MSIKQLTMKNILFTLALLISFNSSSQSWKSSEGGNAFDGKYKTSSIRGKGNNFPYNSPLLVVNRFDGKDINFYIADAGFFQSDTGIQVLWLFDSEPETIYYSLGFSISKDGKILFFNKFKSNENEKLEFEAIEIIEKLTVADEVVMRVSDNYGSNDIVFSLSGSSRAISFVLPKDERQILIDKAVSDRNALAEIEAKNAEIKAKKQLILDDLMNQAREEKLTNSSLSSLENKLEEDLGLSYSGRYSTGKNYKSILVEPSISFDVEGKSWQRYVNVFYILEDGTKEEITGTRWKVEMDAPIFSRVKEKLEADNKHLENILSKYQRVDLIDLLNKEVTEESNIYLKEFNIQDIENVKITLSNYRLKKFWNCKVEIILNDGSERVIENTYVYDLGISKKELKNLGGEIGVAF